MIRDFRAHGIDVYLTLAFESHEAETAARPVERWQLGDPNVPERGDFAIAPEDWPWSPEHRDHVRFVAEFWRTYTEQAVHFARIAEAEGVRMFSLGTETDRLFRTRPDGERWTNDFDRELRAMVAAVRAEYGGLLTYDMHHTAVTGAEWFGPGTRYLWEDLDLDVVGLSAWFELVPESPTAVMRVDELQARYEAIFREHLIPLAASNTGRPIVFLEYGAIATVGSPADPAAGSADRWDGEHMIDGDGNGLDDGLEQQANMYAALFGAMDVYPGVLSGVFFWDNWFGDDAWYAEPGNRYNRSYGVRHKLSEDVVATAYACFGQR